jgi:hypothetical protein
MSVLDSKKLAKELKIDAKALGIPSGAAEDFIKRAIDNTTHILENKTIVTDQDLKKTVTKELKKYNADMAYAYENRDKII